MRFLFDTDTLSHFYDPSSPSHLPIAHRVGALTDADQIFLSILAIYELEYGYANAPAGLQDAIRHRIDEAIEDFALLGLYPELAGLLPELRLEDWGVSSV